MTEQDVLDERKKKRDRLATGLVEILTPADSKKDKAEMTRVVAGILDKLIDNVVRGERRIRKINEAEEVARGATKVKRLGRNGMTARETLALFKDLAEGAALAAAAEAWGFGGGEQYDEFISALEEEESDG